LRSGSLPDSAAQKSVSTAVSTVVHPTPHMNLTPDFAASIRSSISVDERIQTLAESLSKIHGDVNIRRESSGVHLMVACPFCLEQYGRRELRSKHLQINVDKLLGIGEHNMRFLRQNNGKKKGYAQCMKEHGPMSWDEIMGWPTLLDRGLDNVRPAIVNNSAGERYLIPDDRGNMIPDHPGSVVSLLSLPYEHPALCYLRDRDYDPVLLHQQFRAAWCTREAPEGEQYRRWYRKHGAGWKSTPQGRIVFFSDVAGVQACWQARYLEMQIEGQKMLWHPYNERWELRPDIWGPKDGPIKYATATGAMRNSQLCGYDNAVNHARALAEDQPMCVLTEGPLDAARFPDRGMAVLGKYLSPAQSLLVSLNFRRVILAFDADEAGRAAAIHARQELTNYPIKVLDFFRPDEYVGESKVDVGMLGYQVCRERVKQLTAEFDQI